MVKFVCTVVLTLIFPTGYVGLTHAGGFIVHGSSQLLFIATDTRYVLVTATVEIAIVFRTGYSRYVSHTVAR